MDGLVHIVLLSDIVICIPSVTTLLVKPFFIHVFVLSITVRIPFSTF